MSDGDYCSSCGIWIQDTGNSWFCEECGEPTCQSCGKFDHVEKVFLCPECFKKPGESRSSYVHMQKW